MPVRQRSACQLQLQHLAVRANNSCIQAPLLRPPHSRIVQRRITTKFSNTLLFSHFSLFSLSPYHFLTTTSCSTKDLTKHPSNRTVARVEGMLRLCVLISCILVTRNTLFLPRKRQLFQHLLVYGLTSPSSTWRLCSRAHQSSSSHTALHISCAANLLPKLLPFSHTTYWGLANLPVVRRRRHGFKSRKRYSRHELWRSTLHRTCFGDDAHVGFCRWRGSSTGLRRFYWPQLV